MATTKLNIKQIRDLQAEISAINASLANKADISQVLALYPVLHRYSGVTGTTITCPDVYGAHTVKVYRNGMLLSKDESGVATHGTVTFPACAALSSFQAVTDGALDLTVDGTDVTVSSLDFSSCRNFEDIANTIESAANGQLWCDPVYSYAVTPTSGLMFTSPTTGASSTINTNASTTEAMLALLNPSEDTISPVDGSASGDVTNDVSFDTTSSGTVTFNEPLVRTDVVIIETV